MNIESNGQDVGPTQEEIAKAAYYLWEQEGRVNGRDVDHWTQAEALLMAAHNDRCRIAKRIEQLTKREVVE